MNVAVIVAAYQTRAEWLDECLGSIEASADQTSVTLDLRIGVDGCQQSATSLGDIEQPYWWSSVNVGPYVMRNSLIALGPADAFVIFDADDVMLPEYFPLVVHALRTYSLVGPSRTECTEALTPVEERPYRHGVCAFRPDVLTGLGGYQPERLAADVDFIARATRAGFHLHIVKPPCYLRRRHAASLTTAPRTGRESAERRKATHRMERQRLAGKVHVTPVTTPLEFRGHEARSA